MPPRAGQSAAGDRRPRSSRPMPPRNANARDRNPVASASGRAGPGRLDERDVMPRRPAIEAVDTQADPPLAERLPEQGPVLAIDPERARLLGESKVVQPERGRITGRGHMHDHRPIDPEAKRVPTQGVALVGPQRGQHEVAPPGDLGELAHRVQPAQSSADLGQGLLGLRQSFDIDARRAGGHDRRDDDQEQAGAHYLSPSLGKPPRLKNGGTDETSLHSGFPRCVLARYSTERDSGFPRDGDGHWQVSKCRRPAPAPLGLKEERRGGPGGRIGRGGRVGSGAELGAAGRELGLEALDDRRVHLRDPRLA